MPVAARLSSAGVLTVPCHSSRGQVKALKLVATMIGTNRLQTASVIFCAKITAPWAVDLSTVGNSSWHQTGNNCSWAQEVQACRLGWVATVFWVATVLRPKNGPTPHNRLPERRSDCG